MDSKTKKLLKQRLDGAKAFREECKKSVGGRVYFVMCGGFVKIGWTKTTILARMATLMVGSPHDYTVVGMVDGPRQLETDFHKMFAEHRHRGEWFRVEGSLKKFLDELPSSSKGRQKLGETSRSAKRRAALACEEYILSACFKEMVA